MDNEGVFQAVPYALHVTAIVLCCWLLGMCIYVKPYTYRVARVGLGTASRVHQLAHTDRVVV